jgi:hypothetical protein
VPSPARKTSYGGYFPFTKPKAATVVPESRRRVTFDSFGTMFDVLHISDYSPSEIQASWYHKNEIRAMKHRCRDDAAEVSVGDNEREQTKPLSDLTNVRQQQQNEQQQKQQQQQQQQQQEITTRGLENKCSMGALRKKRHRKQAWMSVFKEQSRQKMLGIVDAEALADAYFEVSEPCHVAANMMAIRDAREIQAGLENCILAGELPDKVHRHMRSDSPVSVDKFHLWMDVLTIAKHVGDDNETFDSAHIRLHPLI